MNRVRISSISLPKPAPIIGYSRFLLSPQVREETAKMQLAPHIRTSLPLDAMRNDDLESFLREGEQLQKLPRQQGEVLGIFFRIPIEIISRIRFSPERRLLFYTISRETRLRQTRLHDLAVVRDQATGRIHLVPHRTRFQTASFN
jgi:hypothetical protein